MAQGQGLAGTRVPDSETIAIHHGQVDRGSVDWLVVEGVSPNRREGVPAAIRMRTGRRTGHRVLGLATIGPDATSGLARETIGTLTGPGRLRARHPVRAASAECLR